MVSSSRDAHLKDIFLCNSIKVSLGPVVLSWPGVGSSRFEADSMLSAYQLEGVC